MEYEDDKVIDLEVNEDGVAEETEETGRFKKVMNWCGEHKKECFSLALVAIPAAVDIIKTVSRKGTVKEERRLKDNYIYDRSHGHYYETTKKLTSDEWRHIDALRDNGDNLGDILEEMGLLKK